MLTLEQQLTLRYMTDAVPHYSKQQIEELLEQSLTLLKLKEKHLEAMQQHTGGLMSAPLSQELFKLTFNERADIVSQLEALRAQGKEDAAKQLLDTTAAVMVKDNLFKQHIKRLAFLPS